jgi:hypothetical protein
MDHRTECSESIQVETARNAGTGMGKMNGLSFGFQFIARKEIFISSAAFTTRYIKKKYCLSKE